MTSLAEDVRVIDADTHLTEAPDLWTKRAPAEYKDRVLHVEEVEGQPTWVVDGVELGFALGGGVIDRDGEKFPFSESMVVWGLDRVHQAAYDTKTRLEIMDECGIHAQVLFPNSIGLGGQELSRVEDPVVRRLCVEIYNDAAAELQEESGNPLPADAGPAGVGHRRVRAGGRAGGGPWPAGGQHDFGPPGPRLGRPGQPGVGPAVGGLLRPPPAGALPHRRQPDGDELLRQLLLALAARVREAGHRRLDAVHRQRPGSDQHRIRRHLRPLPEAADGLGRERHGMDSRSSWRRWTTSCGRTPRSRPLELARMPSEYFKDHWYATFWFEQNQGDVQALIDSVGEDNILFETDFPHPTCLYPAPLETIRDKMESLRPESRRKILGDNAAKLYRL